MKMVVLTLLPVGRTVPDIESETVPVSVFNLLPDTLKASCGGLTVPVLTLTPEPVTATSAFRIPISEKGASAKDVAPKNMVGYLPLFSF